MNYLELTKEQITNTYPKMYKSIFGKKTRMIPQYMVIAGTIEDPRGYICGSWMTENKFYLQDSGVMPEYQKRGKIIRHFNIMLQRFNGKKIFANTRNDNTEPMQILLATGFKPVGCKIGENKVFYIEWVREG